MPVIELKTTEQMDSTMKKAVADGFAKAFFDAGEEMVSGNILTHIETEQWIDFRHVENEPSALVVIHPGPLTPVEDYRKIVDAMFGVMKEVLPQISAARIYMTVAQIDHWGWNGGLL